MIKQRLGRGLESLISIKKDKEMSINEIIPNEEQPRKNFLDSKIKSLAKSIERNGLIQPIIVRPYGEKYQIVAGERRFRAALSIGLEKVPVVIKDVKDQDLLELALIENIERADLDLLEEIEAFKVLLDKYNYTHKDLSERFNQSRSSITNKLRILSLPDNIKASIKDKNITLGHARALLSLKNEDMQELYKKVIKEKISVRDLENIIKIKEDKFQNFKNKFKKILKIDISIEKNVVNFKTLENLNIFIKFLEGAIDDRS